MPYNPRTDEQIKQLALDLIEGRAFGSWQIPASDINLLPLVFMPLSLMSRDQLTELTNDGIVQFYAYTRDAMSHAINGYGVYMSIFTLNQQDFDALTKQLIAAFAMRDKFLKG